MTVINLQDAADRRGAWLTVPEILEDLSIGRRTWQRWRALGKTPVCTRTPGGQLRIKRRDYESWLDSLADDEGTNGR
ncbi:helix-turn-helix domain-containing protein [Acrocarpospora sp. B8E8]|uniref:helix-turn-helix transcriptional regulator n=1 Tax=Acrocarpospora sp. B8E8 TaxID=3153572 RepID=UPI00325D4EEF